MTSSTSLVFVIKHLHEMNVEMYIHSLTHSHIYAYSYVLVRPIIQFNLNSV
jgi:hypothetical protein